MSVDAALPAYSAELAAFHRAHRPELRQIIRDLELPRNAQVIDVACGDGAYGMWIAEELGADGIVVGVDRSPAYLDSANRSATDERNKVAADVRSLPFASNVFDVAWCAQSLASLPDPLAAMKEMRRILRPGGRAVILENDSLHDLLLPWPEELELAIRAAQWRAYKASKRHPEKRYIGRRLSGMLRCAGLVEVSRRTYATDRVAPLTAAEREFLARHLDGLREVVWPYLSPTHRRAFDRIMHSGAGQSVVERSDFEMTWLDVVCIGRKESSPSESCPPSRFH
jgi:ubiquinone/menaquinone biosynthesis C-methylase UbiE